MTDNQIKEAVLYAYNRHLKRAVGNKVTAHDMTYHFLKHMGYDEVDWERIQQILITMKEGLENGK